MGLFGGFLSFFWAISFSLSSLVLSLVYFRCT
jgi:hypothetical protein